MTLRVEVDDAGVLVLLVTLHIDQGGEVIAIAVLDLVGVLGRLVAGDGCRGFVESASMPLNTTRISR